MQIGLSWLQFLSQTASDGGHQSAPGRRVLTTAVGFVESLAIIIFSLCNVSLSLGILNFLYVEFSRNLDTLHGTQSPKQWSQEGETKSQISWHADSQTLVHL